MPRPSYDNYCGECRRVTPHVNEYSKAHVASRVTCLECNKDTYYYAHYIHHEDGTTDIASCCADYTLPPPMRDRHTYPRRKGVQADQAKGN